MPDDLSPLFHLDGWEVLGQFVHLLVAYALAVPVAWNRERRTRGAGLRTLPLVAAGSCAFCLIARSALPFGDPQARVVYGIVTGIGFIGGGAILKESGTVSGTATAAATWCMGAVGVAVGFDRLEVALVLSVMMTVTFYFASALKRPEDQEGPPTPPASRSSQEGGGPADADDGSGSAAVPSYRPSRRPTSEPRART